MTMATLMLARQRNEFSRLEAFMARLNRVPQRSAADVLWQQGKKGVEERRVEFLGRQELPQDGAEFVRSSITPLAKKRSIDSPASFGVFRITAKRGALTLKMKPSGVSSRHLAKLAALCVR